MPSAKDIVYVIAGGSAIFGSAILVAREVNSPCTRAAEILRALGEENPLVVPYIDTVAPKGCDLSEFVHCVRIDKDNTCRDGRLYGPGVGGTDTCDMDDGDPVPCFSNDLVPDSDHYDKDRLAKRDIASSVYTELLDKDLPHKDEIISDLTGE